MQPSLRFLLSTAAIACCALASSPSMAFEAEEIGTPICWEGNAGEFAMSTQVVNGQFVQIVVFCDGAAWVQAEYHTLPQIQNDGILP